MWVACALGAGLSDLEALSPHLTTSFYRLPCTSCRVPSILYLCLGRSRPGPRPRRSLSTKPSYRTRSGASPICIQHMYVHAHACMCVGVRVRVCASVHAPRSWRERVRQAPHSAPPPTPHLPPPPRFLLASPRFERSFVQENLASELAAGLDGPATPGGFHVPVRLH